MIFTLTNFVYTLIVLNYSCIGFQVSLATYYLLRYSARAMHVELNLVLSSAGNGSGRFWISYIYTLSMNIRERFLFFWIGSGLVQDRIGIG